MPHMKKMGGKTHSYAKRMKPGGSAVGGGKAIPVDHGPRATGASPAGGGMKGLASWAGKGGGLKSGAKGGKKGY